MTTPEQNDNFAKIFHSERYGQLLVTCDVDEEHKPGVRLAFRPPDLGVCWLGVHFDDTESGWDKAEEAFHKMDLEGAENMINLIPQDVRDTFGLT